MPTAIAGIGRQMRIALALAILLVTPTVAGAQTLDVQMGIAVQPETVTVAQPFVVTVRVRAPRGATIVFPDGPDSASAVQALDPRVVRAATVDAAGGVEQSAQYRLAAWDIGDQPLLLGEIVVRVGAAERRVSSGTAAVFVASVLPDSGADSTARTPKPPRGIIEPVVPWWRAWLPWIIAAIVLAALLWAAWRWWRKRSAGGDVDDEAQAYAAAERAFDRVEALGLVEAGERGRFVALMVDVLREYLARRVPQAEASLTSTELLAAIASATAVPSAQLAPLLAETDLVKFARRPVTRERALELGRDTRGLVKAVEQAVEQEAAARAAAIEQAEVAVRTAHRRGKTAA